MSFLSLECKPTKAKLQKLDREYVWGYCPYVTKIYNSGWHKIRYTKLKKYWVNNSDGKTKMHPSHWQYEMPTDYQRIYNTLNADDAIARTHNRLHAAEEV